MTQALLISQILLWIVVLAMGVVMVALAKQIGVLHERVAPMGALATSSGVKTGEPAPVLDVSTVDGKSLELGGPSDQGKDRLLLFVSHSCPVCEKIIPIAKSVAQSEENLELIFVGEGDPDDHRTVVEEHDLQDFDYVLSPEIGLVYEVGKLPFGILMDDNGIVQSQGMISNREHLESLIIAKETGYDSIQQYISEKDVQDEEAIEEDWSDVQNDVHGASGDDDRPGEQPQNSAPKMKESYMISPEEVSRNDGSE